MERTFRHRYLLKHWSLTHVAEIRHKTSTVILESQGHDRRAARGVDDSLGSPRE